MKTKLINKNISNVYDLSPLQKGILFNYYSDKKSNDYIVQNVFDITGDVNMEFMLKALKLLFDRYDILRTKILYEGTSSPLQVVFRDVEPKLACTSLLQFSESEREQAYDNLLRSEVAQGFDLQKDLLLRARVVYYNESITRIVWNYHHIILDGWSVSIMYAAFLEYYELLCENNSFEEISKRIQAERKRNTDYKDYIEWTAKRNQSRDLDYWAEYLKGYEGTTEVPVMSKTKYTGNDTESIERISISREYSMKAFSFTEKYNVTLNSLLLAVWGIYLQKVNYSNDVVLGKVVSGRNIPENEVGGITEIVGLIANTVPVRIKCDSDTNVLALIKQINSQSIEEGEHHYCSLAEIQALTKQKNGLINTLYVLENFRLDTEAWKHKHLQFQAASYREQTNYGINAIISVEEDLLCIAIRYNPVLYSVRDIKKILAAFSRMLCCTLDNPAIKVSEMSSISKGEEIKVLNEFGNGPVVMPGERSVIQMFEDRVRESGGKPAVRCENKKLSYSELNGYCNRVSALLRMAGAKPDYLIPVLCSRSCELIIGILGTLKSGAAYIPLDMEQPEERIQYILKNSGCKIILTEDNCKKIKIPENVTIINLSEIWDMGGIGKNPEPASRESNLAYCIYTSGTSGVPKGVLIERRNLTNYILHAYRNYLKCAPVIPLFSNCAFDMAVTSIFLPFIAGGEMVIYPGNIIDAIADIFVNQQFTLIKLTPGQLKIALSLEQTGCLPKLETLILGGEALAAADAAECLDKFGSHIKVHNEYGPTEATVGCCDYVYDPVKDEEEMVSIGRPIDNTSIYILKENELCEIGVKGELCIAGSGVARGYAGGKNNQKFVSNPFGKGLMYRSGDIAKWNEDRKLTYMGRADEQWKVRGYRIEPAEVEAALKSLVPIIDAAVTLEKDRAGHASIYAYYVASEQQKADDIRQLLSNKLPSYMIPSGLIQIDEIPLSPSGKVDRSVLPMFRNDSEDIIEARDNYEQNVMSVWEDILGINDFSIHDNFFEIGGNSLLIMKMINLLAKTYPGKIRAGDVFANPTVYLMADHIKRLQNGRMACEKVIFPDSFFRNKDPISLRKFSFPIKQDIARIAIEGVEKDKEELFSVMLFSYCYMISQFIQKQTFQVCIRKDNWYSVIKLTNDDFSDLNQMLKNIRVKYTSADKYESPAVRFINNVNGLFPVFGYNAKAPQEHNIFADFDFNIRVKKNEVLLNVELHNKEIASASAMWLSDEFQRVLEDVM